MKRKALLTVVNWILVFSIPGILLTANISSDTIESNIDVKDLKTNFFQKVVDNKENIDKKEIGEKEDKEEIEELELPEIKNKEKEETTKEIVEDNSSKVETPVFKEETVTEKQTSLATYSGSASYYTANCYGCGGYTSSGLNVSDGTLFYNDSTYGNVRIVAAGREIPLYSIIRINNTSLGSNALAIVLDRGGDIGEGRRFIIDILTNDSEGKGGVDRGVSIEVLRSGR